MISLLKNQLVIGLAAASLIVACASKPPQMQSIDIGADASQELQRTQQMMTEAKSRNLDVLSPKNFERAEDRLEDAQKAMIKGKNKEKVLEKIAEARGWLSEAESRAAVTQAAAQGISDARSGAIAAQAPTLYPKEFNKLEERTRKIAEAAEKGNVKKADRKGDDIANDYRELEVKSVTKRYLGDAQLNMARAKKERAESKAPKTYQLAESRMNEALSLIQSNPRNLPAITQAANNANETTQFLLKVAAGVSEGNTEELVLQSEQQTRRIQGLTAGREATRAELAQTEAELAKTTGRLQQAATALETADRLRAELRPSEAEVFVEDNAVKVRLKGVQFAPSQATLNQKSTALLERVDKVLGTVDVSKITVEGHTDSVGSDAVNKTVSEKRAQAVQNYMVSKGVVPADRVDAIGRGEENPISDNNSAFGRAQNRRIDLIIEPAVTATE